MMTRRGFLRGLVGFAVATKLPKVHTERAIPPPHRVNIEPPAEQPKEWEMLVYGMPIIYTRGLMIRDVQ